MLHPIISVHKQFKLSILMGAIVVGLMGVGCHKTETSPSTPTFANEYTIYQGKIYHQQQPIQLIGANAFHVFGAGGSDMNAWKIDVAREFVGNVKETPLSGQPVQDSHGTWLHSLQAVVDSNRAGGRITIICAFGWDGTNGNEFTGKMPQQSTWWDAFKLQLQNWAGYFKNQPDVWLEVWNEPYRYDRADGYTDAIWLADMNALYQLIRNEGNSNVILIPCAEQGQDESVLVNQGNNFLQNKTNVLFDVHAYEKWLLVPTTEMENRLQQLQQLQLPVLFGETAPMNAGVLMNPAPFLQQMHLRGISTLAWVWKTDGSDQDALLNNQGLPNNLNNNQWGSTFQALCLQPRTP